MHSIIIIELPKNYCMKKDLINRKKNGYTVRKTLNELQNNNSEFFAHTDIPVCSET